MSREPRSSNAAADLRELVSDLLRSFGRATERVPTHVTHDAGPALLSRAASETGLIGRDLAGAGSLAAWLDWFGEPPASTALFGGLAGLLVGLRAASAADPGCVRVARALRDKLAQLPGDSWRPRAPLWSDYDLISGPSGLVLALAADPAGPLDDVLPAARHLARLCDREDLDGLRVGGYRDDPQLAWNHGRINTGLAHGAGGVAAALTAACELAAGSREPSAARAELEPALRRVCRWLHDEAFVDPRGIVTWSPAGREGGPRPAIAASRQSWCYGAPGLAWTLWAAARVLEDEPLRRFAEDAMRSFCGAFDDTFHIDAGGDDDALGVCHGLAGTLVVADAFAQGAQLPEAAELADRLEATLWRRCAELRRLARINMTLLSGASGVLLVLIARATGHRDGLRSIAMRSEAKR